MSLTPLHCGSSLSDVFMFTQLPCLHSRLEWEQLLEQHRTLQDSFDQLQAEARFEADQARQQLQDRQHEIDNFKAQLTVSELMNSVKCRLWPPNCLYVLFLYIFLLLQVLNNSLQSEQEHTSTLISQLRENKENTSKWVLSECVLVALSFLKLHQISMFKITLVLTWLTLLHALRELIETVEQNTQLRKQVSDLTVQSQQEVSTKNSMHVWLLELFGITISS